MTPSKPPGPGPLPIPANTELPRGFKIRLDPRIRFWADGWILIGGSPWRISKLSAPARDLATRLRSAAGGGLHLRSDTDLKSGRVLLDRGFVVPLVEPNSRDDRTPMIIVPVLDAAAKLDRLLVSLGDQEVLVVDDGSRDAEGIRDVTEYHHAQVVRHTINAGPAAARNTGLHEAETEFVAFIDADCRADAAWPRSLLGHFDDPRVAMVAPRVQPTVEGNSLIERYEATRSSLDMGRQAELVRSGARLGFVPSAAIVVRTAALQDSGFDERMRLGEDVDLTWRLSEAGWLVWYDPSVRVTHETRSEPRAWLVRRFEYGTSAADLETRHPGHLAPVRISAWNLAALALVGLGRPGLGAGVTAVAIGALWRQVASIPGAPVLSARVVVQGLVADAASLGRALRREWWPLGVLALATMPRSQVSRAAAAAMLTPLAWEWATERPPLDPIRYIGMRLVDDAAYGTGVLASSVRSRMLSVLLPKVRLPFRA